MRLTEHGGWDDEGREEDEDEDETAEHAGDRAGDHGDHVKHLLVDRHDVLGHPVQHSARLQDRDARSGRRKEGQQILVDRRRSSWPYRSHVEPSWRRAHDRPDQLW